MIFLLTAEYSLKTNTEEINMETTTTLSFNPFANLGEQVEYGALANSCGFGQEKGKSSFACIISSYISQQQEIKALKQEVQRLKDISKERLQEECDATKSLAIKHRDEMLKMLDENQELHRKVENLKLAGYYRTIAFANHGDLNTDDAAFDHYWANDADDDLTLWKVPRHLADVKSAKTSYHGAVEQAFYDGCFGDEHGKLKWFRVREMKEADLIEGGWKPKTEDEEEEEEEICCVICDCELDEAKGEVCLRDWEGEHAPMCAGCWDEKEAEEDAETDEE